MLIANTEANFVGDIAALAVAQRVQYTYLNRSFLYNADVANKH